MTSFFDFNHRCEAMPNDVSFTKLKGSELHLFSADVLVKDILNFKTTLLGFNYCPYCGKSCDDMEGDDE